MKNIEDATKSAQSMIDTAEGLGVRPEPCCLGWKIRSEIWWEMHWRMKSIEILKGGGPEDSIFITAQLGAHLLEMTGVIQNIEEGESWVAVLLQMEVSGTFKSDVKNHRVHSDTIEKKLLTQHLYFLRPNIKRIFIRSKMAIFAR